MKCIKCGNELSDNVKFCNICGTPVEENNTVNQPVEEPKLTENNQTKNKNLDYKMICIITLVIVVIILSFLLIKNTGKKCEQCKCETLSNDVTTTTEKDKQEKVNFAENIDITGITVKAEESNSRTDNIKFLNIVSYDTNSTSFKDKIVGLLFENNNDFLISGTAYLNYYKDGVRIKSNLGNFSNVSPKTKFVVIFRPEIDEEYDSVDITYTTNLKTSSQTYLPLEYCTMKAERITSKYSSEIDVTFENSNEKNANYYVAIIYKKDGKDIGYYTSGAFDVTKGQISKAIFYDASAPADYDDFEVFIQSSYTRND